MNKKTTKTFYSNKFYYIDITKLIQFVITIFYYNSDNNDFQKVLHKRVSKVVSRKSTNKQFMFEVFLINTNRSLLNICNTDRILIERFEIEFYFSVSFLFWIFHEPHIPIHIENISKFIKIYNVTICQILLSKLNRNKN